VNPRREPCRAALAGGRWHFQHGPIDLVIEAHGDTDACNQAHQDCWEAFQSVLGDLVHELAQLRLPLPPSSERGPRLLGPVAQRMVKACQPHAQAGHFITPMAAVAGSVADHLIGCYRRPGIFRSYINNGGDIALHLQAGQHWHVGVVANAHAPSVDAGMRIEGNMPCRGLATSGWRGRSLSLGIADSVTVLALDAATADAAATIIANHVNLEHPAILRRPACEVRDDTDLGERLVTVAVGPLPREAVAKALAQGLACAQKLQAEGLIADALLALAGQWVDTAGAFTRSRPTAASKGSIPPNRSQLELIRHE